ncbi:MAG: cytochrome c oxidase accessory protein CcoG [Myxococcota bacterium]
MKRALPVLNAEPASSLASDGSRNYVHPADVSGRFTTLRRVVFAVLLAIYVALPFIRIGGRPALYLNVLERRFYLFGASFNAQDFWLFLFVLTGVALALFVITTLWGRVWCGYACPQTVFLEGLFRPIERVIEGPRNERIRRNAGPWTLGKVWRKTLKHASFASLSVLLAHIFLSYFISLPALAEMIGRSPGEHPTAFAWMATLSGILYFNFAWFREQLCLAICPYGRLQSTLTDDQSLVVGYDTHRGEPRRKGKRREGAGDCVDCHRCVLVCPTGIDIRNGLQMECIGCAACIDACDAVMHRLGKAPGLVRYDSLAGLDGKERRIRRPRLALYGVVASVWLIATTVAFASRTSFEANLLRPPAGAPFLVRDGEVINALRVHLVNKNDEPMHFTLAAGESANIDLSVRVSDLTLGAGEDRYIPIVASAPVGAQGTAVVVVRSGEDVRTLEARFVGPR